MGETPVQLPEVLVHRDTAQNWRWKRTTPHGEIVAGSSEGCSDQQHCRIQALTRNEPPYVLIVLDHLGAITETEEITRKRDIP